MGGGGGLVQRRPSRNERATKEMRNKGETEFRGRERTLPTLQPLLMVYCIYVYIVHTAFYVIGICVAYNNGINRMFSYC